MAAPLDEVDIVAVLEGVPLVDPAPADPVGVPEAVAVDIVEPVDAVDAVEPVEAVEAVDIVDMPEVDIDVREVEEDEAVEVEEAAAEVEVEEVKDALETEDAPPEAGEVLLKVKFLDCARISSVVVPMRLIW